MYEGGIDPLKNDSSTISVNCKQSMEAIYLTAYKAVSSILAGIYQEGLPKNKAIDIKKLAEEFGIEIVEKTLGSKRDVFRYEVMGYLDYFDYEPGRYQWSIYVNGALGDLTKRYVIAHELAHYFLKDKSHDQKPYTKYCINPILPKDLEEQLCDIIASFLLMPIDIVLDLMRTYIDDHRNERIDFYDWLGYLGRKMGISDYHTVIFYQNIRYLGGILYNYNESDSDETNYKKEDFAKILEKIQQYPDLFR